MSTFEITFTLVCTVLTILFLWWANNDFRIYCFNDKRKIQRLYDLIRKLEKDNRNNLSTISNQEYHLGKLSDTCDFERKETHDKIRKCNFTIADNHTKKAVLVAQLETLEDIHNHLILN